jgi:nucleoside-diphosphate-sugar epimerase
MQFGKMTDAKPCILIVGCGDLGTAIGRELAAEGCLVYGMRRRPPSQSSEIRFVSGDVTQPGTLSCLAGIDPQILVYCVAASEQSDENYRAHYVDGLRHVLAALAHAQNLRHVFFVSSTRVYGQVSDELLNELTAAIPSDFGGRRLLEAEHLLAGLPCASSALRLSGIYGPGRSRMFDLATHPDRWPSQNSWSNRIHRDDAAAFVVFLIHRILNNASVHDCYIVTDSRPVPQYEVLQWLAGRMGFGANRAEPLPASGGKCLSNARMLETGFQLRYPDYTAGYAEMISRLAK